MKESCKPPGKAYLLAAILIAVVIWMVMGAPSEPSHGPIELARGGLLHR